MIPPVPECLRDRTSPVVRNTRCYVWGCFKSLDCIVEDCNNTSQPIMACNLHAELNNNISNIDNLHLVIANNKNITIGIVQPVIYNTVCRFIVRNRVRQRVW